MKKSILITGVSGTGKSSLSNELKRLGFETYDLDAVSDVSMMIDKETRLPVIQEHNNDLQKFKKMEWTYVKERLANLIARQKTDIAFYCGIPFNLKEIFPLFDKVLVLDAKPNVIRERLNNRTSNDFGKTAEIQEWILEFKDKLAEELCQNGALVIDTGASLDQVARKVIEMTGDADALANEAMDRGTI